MPSPLTQAGAIAEPSEYATLAMDRQFSGLFTQCSAFSGAPVPWVQIKFYGAARIDKMIDGLNREISQKLTDVRAPGSSVWNENVFPEIASFYSWSYIQNGMQVVRVLVDCLSAGSYGEIFDASNNGKLGLYAKSRASGAARFLGVNTELFFTDGVEQKKVIATAKVWKANTLYNAGDLIPDTNGNLQQAFSSPLVLDIAAVQYFSRKVPLEITQRHWVRIVTKEPMDLATNSSALLAGLTTATFLNGATVNDIAPVGASGYVFQGRVSVSHADYPQAADTGTVTGYSIDAGGTTGPTQPTWSTAPQGLTVEGTPGTLTWMNFGYPVKDWGLTAAVWPGASNYLNTKGNVSQLYDTELFWRANWAFAQYQVVIDANGQYQQQIGVGGLSGFLEPTWSTALGGATQDGECFWLNIGQPIGWLANFLYTQRQVVIVDTNGNLQWFQATGTTGAFQPTWATTLGATTTDNTITWTCLGPGAVLAAGSYQYTWAFHSIDGSVSTSAPANVVVVNGVLGESLGYAMIVSGPTPADLGYTADQASQIDQVWVFRTAVNQGDPLLLAQFPVSDTNTGGWSYEDYLSDGALIPEIIAPDAEANDPPQVGMTAPVYYQQRVWAIFENTVVYSGGPDTLVGNGNTAFPPLNEIPFASQPVRLVPVLVQDGGLIVLTTDGIRIILGKGTPSDPYYTGDYLELVSVLNYNAVSVFYNQIFVMESNGKVSALAIEYPFNPQTGYSEVGFPIGDQFKRVTTGGENAALFAPASTYVSWNPNSSEDTGMYVSDGAGHWFRMSIINPPESGMLWSPLRSIVGGASAVQSIETAPGVHNLLIGPATSGPILMRDTTDAIFTDDGTPYASWDIKGNIVLCSSGETAEVAHIALKSAAVGTRPQVSLLMDEIEPSEQTPFNNLPISSTDPPNLRASRSYFSDRYSALQNGEAPLCDNFQLKVDYGMQNFADELLMFAIYGAKHAERKQQ